MHLRCFATLGERFAAGHLQLLYQSELRRIQRGHVLNCLSELRKEVHTFLEQQHSCLVEH